LLDGIQLESNTNSCLEVHTVDLGINLSPSLHCWSEQSGGGGHGTVERHGGEGERPDGFGARRREQHGGVVASGREEWTGRGGSWACHRPPLSQPCAGLHQGRRLPPAAASPSCRRPVLREPRAGSHHGPPLHPAERGKPPSAVAPSSCARESLAGCRSAVDLAGVKGEEARSADLSFSSRRTRRGGGSDSSQYGGCEL